MTKQDLHLKDLLTELMPVLADWKLALNEAERSGRRSDFHEFILWSLINPGRVPLEKSSASARSIVNQFKTFNANFRENALKNRIVKFLLIEADSLTGSIAQMQVAFDRLRLNLLRDDERDLTYFLRPGVDDHFVPHGQWARSRAFKAGDGFDKYPDADINPLRPQDHRVMMRPPQR